MHKLKRVLLNGEILGIDTAKFLFRLGFTDRITAAIVRQVAAADLKLRPDHEFEFHFRIINPKGETVDDDATVVVTGEEMNRRLEAIKTGNITAIEATRLRLKKSYRRDRYWD